MGDDPRKHARELAADHLRRGDPKGWFDVLYRRAARQPDLVPWADLRPNPNLTDWLASRNFKPARALVVGCGLGDDAEFVASFGWSVVAFDISTEAIHWARNRFPNSTVDYQSADLFHAPETWFQQFDLVIEIYTLQVLPADVRRRAFAIFADWVKPGGTLCVIARGREPTDPAGQMPWPLHKAEFDDFESAGLRRQCFEDYADRDDPAVRRFRVTMTRPQNGTK